MWKWLSDTVGSPLGLAITNGMLSREQVLKFCQANLALLENPEVKQRIADHVRAGEQAAEMTTRIQEELFVSMGIEAKHGIDCLGRVGSVYKDDKEVMMAFMELVGREELACDEAEKPDEFQQKMDMMNKMRQQRAAIEEHLKGKSAEERLAFVQGMQRQMQHARMQSSAAGNSALTPEQQMQFFQQQYAGQQPGTADSPLPGSQSYSSNKTSFPTNNMVQRR